MTSRSDGLKARLEQLNRRRERAHELEDRQARAAPGRGEPVRRAVMLSPSEHLGLSEWCRATATELGLSRVTGQDVLRTLVVRLLTDPELASQLRAELAAKRARR
ncbi:MAG TPA: hypothetical protein VNP03_25970 [Pseudonocardia sp.]|nr:hypothetical protein [Pseudonocardia sp.]